MKHSDYIHPYAGKDVPWLLRAQAEKNPDGVHLAWEPFEGKACTWTYSQFLGEVEALAGGLAARGIGTGDRVLIHMNNCPEFLFAWHACALLGAVAVTTNPRSAASEMEYFIDHSQVRYALTQPEFLELIRGRRGDIEWIASTISNSDSAQEFDIGDAIPYGELVGDAADIPKRQADPMAPVSVQYTSGTTSRPKGVVWTHANALWGGQVGTTHNAISSADTAIVFTPLCHTNAMSWAHFPVLWSGGTMVLQPKFSASRFWPVALKHRCTWANVIPFAVGALASIEVPEKHDFRFWVVGAGNVGIAEQLFRLPFVGAWGMTELITHGTYTPIHLPCPEMSMGMPTPELQLKVVDESGEQVSPGETGLLKVKGVRGVSLFAEYLKNPEATDGSYDEDGWFDTGDRVYQMADGHLRFADRSKDMLKVGAENVAASEIEAVVATVPGVMENAVVGKPDPMLDEVPVAFVRAVNAGDELAVQIIEACEKNLANFKVPREVHFLEEFPRAELNKIAKNKLRDQLK
ncbi:ATP-dependent acyl-CoA ligase [Halioglobus maricola]|uniref:ATP-dependent acyl-CoA ligase n=1 Tax=Halioglobus maricola TaxID=2601894 RepID=A0A5P9NHY4_9GAMM|nr:AMP-binding protein [Halioglobus maricola]QFU75411.1 ATP-dependent acyl-CoA ligase [Halioglobus maricola]